MNEQDAARAAEAIFQLERTMAEWVPRLTVALERMAESVAMMSDAVQQLNERLRARDDIETAVLRARYEATAKYQQR